MPRGIFKRKTKVTQERFLKAVYACYGVPQQIADVCRVSLETVYHYKHEWQLEEDFVKAEDLYSDQCIDVVTESITKKRNVLSAQWWLERKAKHRGFGQEQKIQITGRLDGISDDELDKRLTATEAIVTATQNGKAITSGGEGTTPL